MAQYALMVWGPSEPGEFDSYPTAEERDAQMEATGAFNAKLREGGHFVFANGLVEASASTVVDNRGSAPIITDGPYVESKEYIAGFWIIEAADLDEALTLTTEASRACGRPLEIRPMHGG